MSSMHIYFSFQLMKRFITWLKEAEEESDEESDDESD